MATLNLNDPVNGTVADATLIANNNNAIKNVVNGGLDNANITASAAIAISKLASYPSDGTKFLNGAGGWTTPSSTYVNPTPALSLPATPTDLQRAILVDSTSAPTYSWEFQWSATASKWLFMGGAPAWSEVLTSQTTTSNTYTDLGTVGPSITVPRAGTYEITFSAVAGNSSANEGAFVAAKLGSTSTSDNDAFFYSVGPAAFETTGGTTIVRSGLAANDVIKLQYRGQTSGHTYTFANRRLSVRPVVVT